MLALQKNLIDTEQRIALARGYFNDIATHYNTRLEIVPEKFVAWLGAMQPQTLMAANEFERAALPVDLGRLNATPPVARKHTAGPRPQPKEIISHRGHGGHGEEKGLENNIFSVSSVTSVAVRFLYPCSVREL